MRKYWGEIVVLALLLGCLGMMWRAQAQLRDAWPAHSFRWEQPLEAAQARELFRVREDGGDAVAALWWEQKGTARTATAQVQANAVRFWGERSLIERLTFLSGTDLGGAQEGSAIVSEEFALALWGSTDVVGQTFTWEGETCQAAGVFAGEKALLYLPSGQEAEHFRALELLGGAEDPIQAADEVLLRCGIAPFDGAFYGPELAAALEWLGWLPLGICGVLCLLRLRNLYPIRSEKLRRALRWAGIFLLAALLPVVIGRLPGWATPARWSDFTFWVDLWTAAGERLEEALCAPRWTKDLPAQKALLRWMLGWAGSLLCLQRLWFGARAPRGEEKQTR